MFDPTMKCQTKSGNPVEIIAVLPPEKMTDRKERIIALVYQGDERPTIETYEIDGRYSSSSPTSWDLVNTQIWAPTPEQYAALVERERLGAR